MLRPLSPRFKRFLKNFVVLLVALTVVTLSIFFVSAGLITHPLVVGPILILGLLAKVAWEIS